MFMWSGCNEDRDLATFLHVLQVNNYSKILAVLLLQVSCIKDPEYKQSSLLGFLQTEV